MLPLLGAGTLEASSLWLRPTTNERGFFSDRVASRVGDILTIDISEATTMKNTLKTTTAKDATIINTVTKFLFNTSGFGKHNKELPGTSLTGKNTYAGSGTVNNSNTLTSKVSVIVVDVLPNGNLVFEGVRKVAYSKEVEYAVLRGVVRQYDITADNTIASYKIADAQLEFVQEGSISAAQKKGWLLRFNDFVNPF